VFEAATLGGARSLAAPTRIVLDWGNGHLFSLRQSAGGERNQTVERDQTVERNQTAVAHCEDMCQASECFAHNPNSLKSSADVQSS
jgi:hypothetical protein